MNVKVVGIEAQSSKMPETFANLRPVGAVKLEPEENAYDPWAVGVWKDGVQLGYLPGRKVDGQYVGTELQRHVVGKGGDVAMVASYAYYDGEQWNEEHKGRLMSVKLVFAEPEVAGRVFGGKYLRVTSFLSYFDPYGGGDGLIRWAFDQSDTYDGYREALNKTAEDGTAMHDAIERTLRGEKVDGLPRGWAAFVKKYEPEMCYAEERFWDSELMVTGQPDFVGYVTIKGARVLAVLDWKSSKKPSMKHKLQAAIYATNAQWDGAKPSHGMVVAFGAENKQGFSASVIDTENITSYYTGMRHVRRAMDCIGVWIPDDKHFQKGDDI